MPPILTYDEMMKNEMGASFDQSMIDDKARMEYDLNMAEMMKNIQIPELPALCVPGDMCRRNAMGDQ